VLHNTASNTQALVVAVGLVDPSKAQKEFLLARRLGRVRKDRSEEKKGGGEVRDSGTNDANSDDDDELDDFTGAKLIRGRRMSLDKRGMR
jgi:hypothetical protein